MFPPMGCLQSRNVFVIISAATWLKGSCHGKSGIMLLVTMPRADSRLKRGGGGDGKKGVGRWGGWDVELNGRTAHGWQYKKSCRTYRLYGHQTCRHFGGCDRWWLGFLAHALFKLYTLDKRNSPPLIGLRLSIIHVLFYFCITEHPTNNRAAAPINQCSRKLSAFGFSHAETQRKPGWTGLFCLLTFKLVKNHGSWRE